MNYFVTWEQWDEIEAVPLNAIDIYQGTEVRFKATVTLEQKK